MPENPEPMKDVIVHHFARMFSSTKTMLTEYGMNVFYNTTTRKGRHIEMTRPISFYKIFIWIGNTTKVYGFAVESVKRFQVGGIEKSATSIFGIAFLEGDSVSIDSENQR